MLSGLLGFFVLVEPISILVWNEYVGSNYRIGFVGAVLSDKGKRAMYDAGLFDPLDGDDQVNF